MKIILVLLSELKLSNAILQ